MDSLISLGYKPDVIDGFIMGKQAIYEHIRDSPIKLWVFSGGDSYVIHGDSPQVSLKMLNLKDKRFMLICYSMESVLYQMNIPIVDRGINKKEFFNQTIPSQSKNHYLFEGIKTPMRSRRNHHWYFRKEDIKAPVELLASYNGEAMIAAYKNMVMIQYHPEGSVDGKKIIGNWIAKAEAEAEVEVEAEADTYI